MLRKSLHKYPRSQTDDRRAPWNSAKDFPHARATLMLWASLLLMIIVLELLPADSAPIELASGAGLNDKVLHFAAYAAVTVVPVLGLGLRAALPLIIGTELVGTGLEVLQFLVTNRSAETADAIANTCGILFGITVAWLLRPLTRFRMREK